MGCWCDLSVECPPDTSPHTGSLTILHSDRFSYTDCDLTLTLTLTHTLTDCLSCSFESRNQDQLADPSSPIWYCLILFVTEYSGCIFMKYMHSVDVSFGEAAYFLEQIVGPSFQGSEYAVVVAPLAELPH